MGLIESLERFLETGKAYVRPLSDFIAAVVAGTFSTVMEWYMGKAVSVAVVVADEGASTAYPVEVPYTFPLTSKAFFIIPLH